MHEYLKHYQMRITALSPIHVGNGTKLGKKEYIQQGLRNPIIVPDTAKMFHDLCLLKRDRAYAEFMLNEKRQGLGQWLKEQGIKPERIISWKRYSLDAGDVFLRKGTGRNDKPCEEVLSFVKDAYEEPFVPGSTLKGMLRTALLCWRVHEHPDCYVQAKENLSRAAADIARKKRGSYLKRETDALEIAAFHTLKRDEKRQSNAVNSVMSGLIVSDSAPISEKQLILTQKIDYTLRGEERSLPILRESLKPGTQIDFDLTIDTRICDVSIEEILAALEYFQEVSYEYFYSRFRRGTKAKGTVWLGGGTGFLSKTILYPLYGEKAVGLTDKTFHVTLGDKNYEKHKHVRDIANAVAPHMCKCTRYQGKLYDMGMGKLEVLN